jgi:dTMP kinase
LPILSTALLVQKDRMATQKTMFISLEGSEGVGKSTSLAFVKQYIESLGHQVLITREPGGTALAEEIRSLLLTKRDESVEINTELLLMFAARCQHVEQVIKPALEQGKWVICDRFVDASYAYQGAGRGIAVSKITELEDWCLQGFKPDLTILLDMPVELGLERTKQRGEADRFEVEKISFFKAIREAYLNRAKNEPDRITVIDASPDLETVQASLEKLLENRCKQ